MGAAALPSRESQPTTNFFGWRGWPNRRVWGGSDGVAGDIWERLAPALHALGADARFLHSVPARWNELGALGPIIGCNVMVYAMWWLAPSRVMARHFVHSPLRGPPWAAVLSAFSHQTILHLACNMFALHSFGTHLQQQWGAPSFGGLYVSACVASGAMVSCLAIAFPRALALPGLGASGAVFTVVAAVCLLEPAAQVRIPFVPADWFSVSGENFLKCIIPFDAAGLVWVIAGMPSPLGHAAHLGGQAFGVWLILGGGLLLFEHAVSQARLQLKKGARK